jgi:hypothetical protein
LSFHSSFDLTSAVLGGFEAPARELIQPSLYFDRAASYLPFPLGPQYCFSIDVNADIPIDQDLPDLIRQIRDRAEVGSPHAPSPLYESMRQGLELERKTIATQFP